jgi:putative transposase
MRARSFATLVALRRKTCHDLLVNKYKSGASTKYRVVFNYVFCPKYRRRVLRGDIANRINELFNQACDVNGWSLEELNILSDHVHLMVEVNTRTSMARVAHLLKGGSSRIIRLEYPELEEFLWGDSFWSDGYFGESIGITNEKVMREYIRNQRKS